MIDVALAIIVNRLNQQLASPETAPEDAVVLMDFADSSGPAPDAQDKIVVLVSNITEDTVTRGLPRPVSDANLRKRDPVNLIIQIVVAANFEPSRYSRGLQALSRAVEFFQANPVFDRNNSPDMAGKGIERLSIDMESLSVDAVSQLWGVLGGRYMPSVVYRIRTVAIDSGAVIDDQSAIRGIASDSRIKGS